MDCKHHLTNLGIGFLVILISPVHQERIKTVEIRVGLVVRIPLEFVIFVLALGVWLHVMTEISLFQRGFLRISFLTYICSSDDKINICILKEIWKLHRVK